MVNSLRLRSSSAEDAAPPSPTEPMAPVPATGAASDFAALADVTPGVLRTTNENMRSGWSTVERSSTTEVAEVVAVADSLVCGATARVRMPTFDATTAGAAPFADAAATAGRAAT